jgi:hypothetical protein
VGIGGNAMKCKWLGIGVGGVAPLLPSLAPCSNKWASPTGGGNVISPLHVLPPFPPFPPFLSFLHFVACDDGGGDKGHRGFSGGGRVGTWVVPPPPPSSPSQKKW